MTKVENLKKVLEGQEVSQIPFSFWTHFPEIDLDPDKIATVTYDFYKQHDLAFIKTMNNGMYATEDYGCQADYSAIATGGVATLAATPIKTYDDWAKLPEVRLDQAPALQRELSYLKKLLTLVGDEAPVVMTIFSPLTIADKMISDDIKEHIANDDKGYLKKALEKIASLNAKLAEEAIKLGASGIYFASQLSTFERLTPAEYLAFGKPYDLIVLDGAKQGWFNSLHLHGNDTMFDLVKDYPVHAINWHIGESFPGPREGQIYSGKAILGGLNRWDISRSSYNNLHHQIYRTLLDTNGKGIILSPSCVIPHPYDDTIIDYIKQVKKETELLVLDNSLESSQL